MRTTRASARRRPVGWWVTLLMVAAFFPAGGCTVYNSIDRESDGTYVITGFVWFYPLLFPVIMPFVYEGQYDEATRTMNLRRARS